MALSTAEARRRRKARGQCLWCAAPAMPGTTLCERHHAYNRQQSRKRWGNAPQPDDELLARLSDSERAMYLRELAKPLGERWR